MRTTLKIVLPLIISVAVISLLFAAYQVRTERRILRNDLSRSAVTLGESLQQSIELLPDKGREKNLQRLVDRFSERQHLKGVAVYDTDGKALAITPALAPVFKTRPTTATRAAEKDAGYGEFLKVERQPMHIYALPLHNAAKPAGVLALYHDTTYIDIQLSHTLRDALLTALIQTLLITALAMVLVRWTFTNPLTRTAKWLRTLRTGQSHAPPTLPEGEIFDQLHHEVTHLARDLNAARASAEKEARLRDTNASQWTSERLRVSLRNKLKGQQLFVVSNREPYMHVLNENRSVSVMVPASGLVTALEPVLLACDGTWIAHRAGRRDREMVDSHDRLRVPPDRPSYNLRRVWLTAEEEKGYYQGFANEGLWPLCHIAHTRPIFRSDDWQQYQVVNHRFADAVLEEMADSDQPVVLVQDYHFALLPRLLKERRPDARVAIFWHIPWPNSEAFGICPWQRELLDGLLGADLIGFHTQFHCNNFLETVERSLESRVEWERFSVRRNGHSTSVRPFPISVACGARATEADSSSLPERLRAEVLQELGVEATLLGVGVDRVDY